MKVKCVRVPPLFDKLMSEGDIFEAEYVEYGGYGGYVLNIGGDTEHKYVGATTFKLHFVETEEAPKPNRSSEETPDDISAWLCQNKADPLAAACKEIHMLRKSLHDVKSKMSGKLGSALAIVDLSREHQKKIETLMKLAQPTE